MWRKVVFLNYILNVYNPWNIYGNEKIKNIKDPYKSGIIYTNPHSCVYTQLYIVVYTYGCIWQLSTNTTVYDIVVSSTET